MSTVITRVELRYEQDVVYARYRARIIAELLGFEKSDQTRISTAVSEIARNVFQYAGGGEIEFIIDAGREPNVFAITVRDYGKGIARLDEILEGRFASETGIGQGITVSRRLMDHFEIDTRPGGTMIVMGKNLPITAPQVTPALLTRIADVLAKTAPQNPCDEIRLQNLDLIRMLEELRPQQEALARVTRELDETNRGVVALYVEQDNNAVALRSLSENLEKRVEERTRELQKANEGLRENEEKFRVVFENANDAILLIARSPDGLPEKFIEVNETACRRLKFTRDEFLRLSIRDIDAPETWVKIHDNMKNVMENGHTTFEGVHVTKDGKRISVEISAQTLILHGQDLILAHVRDITERKRAEGALRESEQELRAVFNAAQDGMLVADPETHRFVLANAAILKQTGYTEAELLSRSISDMHPPADLLYVIEQFEKLNLGVTNLAPDIPVQRKDGTVFFADINASMVPLKGRQYSLGIFRDITERKLVEVERARLAAIETYSEDALIAKTLDGIITSWNAGAERIFGYSAQEIVGRNASLLDTPEHPDDTHSILERIRNGEPVIRYETRRRKKDGGIINISLTASQIRDTQNHLIGISTIAHDITPRKRAEKELLLKNYVFESALEGNAIADMQGNVTHVNPAFMQLWGYPQKEDLIGRSISTFFADEQDALPVLEALDSTGRWEGEILAKRKDGSTFFSDCVATAILDETGTRIGFHSAHRDVTEERRIRQALRESEERFRTLFEEALDGITLADAKTGIIIDCNPAMAAIAGRVRAELIGQPQSILHPADPGYPTLSPTFRQHLTEKRGHLLETQLVTKSGIIREVEIKANILNIQGQAIMQGIFHDITDRKRAEEAKIASETRYRRLFEAAQDGILILDAETGQIVEVNPFLITMLGFSREQFLGKKLWDVGLFKDIAANKENFEELQRKEYIRYEDLPLETADGKHIDVEFVSNVYTVDNRKVIQCNIRNITDRKLAEEAKIASEIRYRRLFEAAQDGILILDAETGQIVEVNPFLITMLGFSREQFLGKKLWEVGLFKDIAANKENFEELQRKEYIRYEDLPLETADGKHIAAEFVSNVYEVNKKKVIQCNIRNITDRKQAEDALRQKNEEVDGYFTHTLDLLSIADTAGHFRRLNKEWESALGYSLAEMEGKHLLDFVHPDDMETSRKAMYELGQGKQVLQFTNRYRHKDGSYRWIEWRSFPVGNFIYASARDVTERKKMTEQIEASLAEKETLLKEVHHRVKNNLQIIASLLNLQIRKTTDPQTIEALKDSQSRVRSMAIVHEHLYKGKDFSHINLENYIRALGKVIFSSYEAGNLGVRFDLDIHDIYVDTNTAIPLGLISNELITNSLKYAFHDKNDGKLSITATEDPVALTFVVADNGSGMAPGITLVNQPSLGLQLVSSLTDQLNGTVAIDRTGGTKFTFRFPKPVEQKPTGKADP